MPSASSAAALGLGGMFVATQFATNTFTSPVTQAPQLRGASSTTNKPSISALGAGLACSSVVVAAASAGAGNSMRTVRVARAAREAPKVLAGTGGPLPESFWDPAGFTNNKTDEELLFYRAAELKHGRIAMAAVVGWFTNASGFHYLGDLWLKKPASDNPIEAFNQLSLLGVFQMVFFIGCLEWLTTVPCPPPKDAPWDVIGMSDVLEEEDTDENPMAEYKKIQMQELNNSRLAMVAIIGLIVQATTTGDYGGKLDIVNPVFTNWTSAVPEVPFQPPTIYPGQVWPQFTLKWPTLAQNFLYN
ncbi:Photosystem I chain J [Amphidinium carterae]